MRNTILVALSLCISAVCSISVAQDSTPPGQQSLQAVIEMLESMQARELVQTETPKPKRKKERSSLTANPEIERSNLEIQRANMEKAIRCEIIEELQQQTIERDYMRLKIKEELEEERQKKLENESRELLRERMEDYRSMGDGYLSAVPTAYIRERYVASPTVVRQSIATPATLPIRVPVVAPVRARLMLHHARPAVVLGCCN